MFIAKRKARTEAHSFKEKGNLLETVRRNNLAAKITNDLGCATRRKSMPAIF